MINTAPVAQSWFDHRAMAYTVPPPIIPPRAYLTKDVLRSVMERSDFERRHRQWHLLSEEEMEKMWQFTRAYREDGFGRQAIKTKDKRRAPATSEDPLVLSSMSSSCRMSGSTWKERAAAGKKVLTSEFTLLDELLMQFSGKIIAAGGAIYRACTYGYLSCDVDLFFIDPNCDHQKLLADAIAFMISQWKAVRAAEPSEEGDGYSLIFVGEHVTTLYLGEAGKEIKYQFIHRVYPDIGSLLGGFDIGLSMVAYDGHRFYMTEFGAFSFMGQLLVVDISRRSTSFEHRLEKYGYRSTIVLPGLPGDLFDQPNLIPEKIKYDELLRRIAEKYPDYQNPEFWEDDDVVQEVLMFVDSLGYDVDSLGYGEQLKFVDIWHKFRTKHFETPYLTISNESPGDDRENYAVVRPNIAKIAKRLICEDYASYFPKWIYDKPRNKSDYGDPGEGAIHPVVLAINANTQKMDVFGYLFDNIDQVTELHHYSESSSNEAKAKLTAMFKQAKHGLNAEIYGRICSGGHVKWITENPGRQWTASINPIIENPREWYGEHYRPFLLGHSDVVKTILLARLRRGNLFAELPKDVFKMFLAKIMVVDAAAHLEPKAL